MNTPVNSEIANLLKEKGFDLQYKRKYSSFSRINDAEDFCKNFPNKLSEDSYEIFKDQDNEGDVHSCSIILNEFEKIPTISDVVMVLYEKCGIWIVVDIDEDDNNIIYAIRGTKTTHFDEGFDSPTEAYEQAIEYTLKNLI